MDDCLFCKIIKKEIPSTFIAENKQVIVINDIAPKAPIHYLIIPKIHIENINALQETKEHIIAMQEIMNMIRTLASKLPEPKAFTLISNNGISAGQSVFHMHWHLLAGKNIYEHGFKL